MLELSKGILTPYGEDVFEFLEWLHKVTPLAGRSGTLSNYAEVAFLDHLGKTAFSMPQTWLALCTSVPDSSKTGSTIAEPSYTGYGRYQIAAGGWNAAVSGGAGVASTKTNNGGFSMNNCTAGSATIVGWALCDASTAGNMLAWGTCVSTVVSPQQTPPTVADQGLVLTNL